VRPLAEMYSNCILQPNCHSCAATCRIQTKSWVDIPYRFRFLSNYLVLVIVIVIVIVSAGHDLAISPQNAICIITTFVHFFAFPHAVFGTTYLDVGYLVFCYSDVLLIAFNADRL